MRTGDPDDENRNCPSVAYSWVGKGGGRHIGREFPTENTIPSRVMCVIPNHSTQLLFLVCCLCVFSFRPSRPTTFLGRIGRFGWFFLLTQCAFHLPCLLLPSGEGSLRMRRSGFYPPPTVCSSGRASRWVRSLEQVLRGFNNIKISYISLNNSNKSKIFSNFCMSFSAFIISIIQIFYNHIFKK